MNGLEKRSGHAEEFAQAMVEVHEHVRKTLQQNTLKVKAKVDLKRRNVQFQVGNMVMVHLNKDWLPRGSHTKLMMKKIGPCEILEKYGENAYKVALPPDVAISSIFNVSDITLYKGSNKEVGAEAKKHESNDWIQGLPSKEKPQMECIINSREAMRTRNKVHLEHLVKWKGLLDSEATWLPETEILRQGGDIQQLVSKRT